MADPFIFTPEATADFISNDEDFLEHHRDTNDMLDLGSFDDVPPIDNLERTNIRSGKVENTLKAPFRFICKLVLNRKQGRFGGTGLFISKRHVLTAGHSIIPKPSLGRTQSIQIIPGLSGRAMPFGSQVSEEFKVSRKWLKMKRDHDYALIRLPDETLFNRIKGHFFLERPGKKKKIEVFGGGYADLPPFGQENPLGTQIITKGKILKVRKNRISFSNSLKVGYSGGPLYKSELVSNGKRYFMCHGLGCYQFRSGNFGPRVNDAMIKELRTMIQGNWS